MALLLSACGGNPFLPDGDGSGNGPPGTEGPVGSKGSAITRTEKTVTTAGKDYGNGFAEGFVLNANDPTDPGDDTFSVDGLAFDGANVYQRGTTVSDIGPFQVYEGDSTYTDAVTGTPIDQFLYRAIYGVSDSTRTSFAIVRTGAYIPYGFGGFIYKRNGGVTIPTSGQANYSGSYAGLRDFNGDGGLEYTTGDMTMGIDFADFNAGAGVKGEITNRRIFDISNTEVTDDVVAAINTEYSTALTEIPNLLFTVGPGALKSTGEVSQGITSQAGANIFESGKYYAILSDNSDPLAPLAGEVVGVIVVESNETRGGVSGVTARETGGFILLRQ